MKEQFIEKRFKPESLQKIDLINSILAEYAAEGYDLSLRQLYYQLVARGYIENSERSYKRTGDLLNNARLAGLVDWNMITDRGRHTVFSTHWDNPAEIVEAAADQFAIDKWENQDYHVEVMVEKQALEGVLIPVCRELDIRFTANKGYSSSSTMYDIGKRLLGKYGNHEIIVFYLGDHDPSGIDMTRDVEDRLKLFADINDIQVERLALNWDQIEQWQPPKNPAKETDARFKQYRRRYGESSWELDAIEPRILAELVKTAVWKYRDLDKWKEAVNREDEMRRELQKFVDNYGK
ncbi:MAG: hypothetical protein JW908_00700 [Anaerolineales bacterium]|nr:hypothetical protein [Anaerolineales bacterium]